MRFFGSSIKKSLILKLEALIMTTSDMTPCKSVLHNDESFSVIASELEEGMAVVSN